MPAPYPDQSSLGDYIGTSTPLNITGPFPGLGYATGATTINTIVNGTPGQHLVIDGTGIPLWVTETTTFNFVGQTGTTEVVDHGDTITFSSSNLIKTTSAATRVLDIQLDTTSATLGQVVTFDGVNAVWQNSSGELTTVSDTNSIDLTLTGIDITADLKISATTPNIATVVTDGLLVQETVTSYTDVSGTSNINIGSFTHENGSVSLINESLTSLSQSLLTGDITYISEDSSLTPSVAKVISTDLNNSITVGSDGGAYYNSPALVTNASWDDVTNTIAITFDDLSVVNVPIVDNVTSFLSDFTISDGTNSSVINNHDTVGFAASSGITQVVSPNTITTSVKLSTDAGNDLSFGTDSGLMLDVSAFAQNIYTNDGTILSNRTVFLDNKSLVFNTTNRDLIKMSATGIENVEIDAEILTLGLSVTETRLGTFNMVNSLATVGQVLTLQDAITGRVEYQSLSSLLPTETEEYFDAQSGTTVVLANTPAASTVVQVMKNGQVLRNGSTRDYTISSNTITFNVTLVSDDIHVIYKF